jgi:hypothetical protein
VSGAVLAVLEVDVAYRSTRFPASGLVPSKNKNPGTAANGRGNGVLRRRELTGS